MTGNKEIIPVENMIIDITIAYIRIELEINNTYRESDHIETINMT